MIADLEDRQLVRLACAALVGVSADTESAKARVLVNTGYFRLKEAYRALDLMRAEPARAPYPFCRTPQQCASVGYCRRDPACNE